MNKKPLRDMVKGEYGRKVAYTNYDTVTKDNVATVVDQCMTVFDFNYSIFEYLWNYYKGDQPILYRTKTVRDDIVNKIVENHAFEIVAYKTGETYSEPIQCVARTKDKSLNENVDKLNEYLNDAFKHSRDISAGTWQSATGTGYKAARFDRYGAAPFGIVVPTPLNTFVIYNEDTEEPLLAVQIRKDVNGEEYKQIYTNTHECKLYGKDVIDWKIHGFGGIPIVEYPNNYERMSDVELVIDILDAINNMQSNRMDGVEQFVQSWVKFVNCSIDEETFRQMKLMGALVVKSNNGENKADVEVMSQELNQSESQVAKDDLWNNAMSILAMPNKQGGSKTGDSQGAVELRNGWDFAKSRARLKDACVIESEKRLIKVILNILRINGDDLGLNIRDFDVKISHSPTDALIVKSQALDYLLKLGIHPLVAISTCGLWSDPEKTYTMSKPYLDKKWKVDDGTQIDVDELQKKVSLMISCLEAGMSVEDAANKAGLPDIDLNADGFSKWNYNDDSSDGHEDKEEVEGDE